MNYSLSKALFEDPKSLPKFFNWEREVVFFSGTFNPWHEGHSECLRAVHDKQVLLCPDWSPWKKEGTQDIQELEMKAKEFSHVELFRGLIESGKFNPTFEWFTELKISKPSFLMGGDQWLKFQDWAHPKKILEKCHAFYVVPRQTSHDQMALYLEKYFDSFASKVHFLKHHPHEDKSSSDIRAKKNPE